MCGIGGFIDWAGCLSSAEKTHALHVMQKAMKHRGPDAQNREPLNMELVTTPILPAYSVPEKYQSLFRVTLSF